MLVVSDEQREILGVEGAPTPLIDDIAGKCYMVMPVEWSASEEGFFRAIMPGVGAVAEAEVPSDAAIALAVVLRKMLDQI